MAKSTSTCRKRRTQNQNQNQYGMEFSESEMDVAEQLIQLSGDSSGDQDHTNNNSVEEEKGEEEEEEEGKAAEQGHKCDAVDVSSTNIGELIFPNNTSLKEEEKGEEEEEDQILWQRKMRFRSMYDLYSSTNPITLVKAKRRKLTPSVK